MKQTKMQQRNSEYMYEKYLKKYDSQHPYNKKQRRKTRFEKFKQLIAKNWIALAGLIITVLTLIVTLIK